VRTRTAKLVSVLSIVSSVMAFEESAQAQPTATGFSANRFEPSERGSDWFASESLDLRGTVRPAVGVVADYHAPPLATFGDPQKKIVSSMLAFHLGAALNIVGRFRLAVSLPLVASADGQTPTRQPGDTQPFYAAPSGGGLGDLRFGADVRVGGRYGDPFTVAIGMRAWAPTGSESAYTGDGKWRVATHLAFAGDISAFVYAAKIGYGYRAREAVFAGSPFGGNEAFFSVAMGLRVLDKKLVVGPEAFGRTWVDDRFAKRTTPIEALLGAHYSILPFLRVGAGVGTGLTNAYGAPDIRGLFNLEFFAEAHDDRDGDGILDDDDACPDVKGKPSRDPAKNGCPEDGKPPADQDHDDVPDAEDACVDVPGVKTSDPKTNGCPPDKDGDGVYDAEDACIDVAGVKTSDPKTNGCPPDRDNDGIIDKEDACPDEPGLKTSDPKTNGCPDPDRDKDGIPNATDACPDEPGHADPDPKKNGCPKAFVRAGEIKITDQVKFKTGSAQIENNKDSNEVLQAVYKVLSDHPEIKMVRVEGHTDNQGSAAMNKKLSGERAASVVKWLVTQGVDKARLTSQGFGLDRPIDSNKTADGRKNNRRVEFHIESSTPANPPP
jgi:OmpA-OmpF porin, OOP family